MRDYLKKEWPSLLLLVIPFLMIPFVWDRLPDVMPTHWNSRGEIDGYSSKPFALFLLPSLSVGLYLLLFFFPLIDPKRKTAARQKPLAAYRFFMPLILDAIFFVMIFQGLGYAFDIGHMILLIVLLLFLVLGNYLSSLKPNYFVGIRTPWTLEDPEIWRKTHRLGGRIWVGISLLLLPCWLVLDVDLFGKLFFGGVMIMAGIPVAYSLILYLRKRNEPVTNDQ